MFLCRPRRCGCLGQGLGQLAAGVRRVDLLVDDTDFDRAVHAAGDPLVLGGQFLVQRLAFGLGCGGQLLLVQDADGGLGAHHGDLGVRPGEHLRRAQRPGVHRDVGAAVDLAGHQRDAGNRGLTEGVQQLRAAADHAAPLLVDAGQVARHVDDRRPAGCRTHRTGARNGLPSRRSRSSGSRRDAAGCWPSRRRCDRTAGPARPPSTGPTWTGTLRRARHSSSSASTRGCTS